jgi:DNA-binding NarL/FixJ family response regulator
MTGETVWVRVVDDHAVVREGYRRLLELNADVQMCGDALRCSAGLSAALRIAAPSPPTR